MMLTWKIFVIIMSMVSLTLQMNPSHAGSSSGSSQVTDPDSPSDTDSESPWVIDPESGIHYPLACNNNYNFFYPFGNAYKCYEMIRLYCPTGQKYGDVYGQNKSETHENNERDPYRRKDSVKYGQKENDLCYENNERDPYTWVDKFFYGLQLNPGKFKLPEEFCEGKAPNCINVLQNYTGEALCPMWARDQFTNSVSIKEVRLHIAWYALKHRDLFVVEKEIKAKNSLKDFLGVPEEEMIRLYCPTAEIGLIGSNDCAKQGIFFYRQKYGDVYGPNKSETHGQKDSVKYGQRESDLCYENNERDPYTWVDKFFYDLHLKPGKFKLPKEFCKGKAPNCINVLQNYTSEALCPMWAREQFTNSVSKKEVRLHIAWFALKHRDLFVVEKEIKAKNSLKVFLGVPEEDFETEYLEHISDHVSSNDPEYDPSRFCRKFENSPIKMKFSNFLAKHLKLEPDYY